MEKDEWNKTFAHIMTWYPAWRPDKLVSASWFQELGNFKSEMILAAIKRLACETASPYPPQIFQVYKMLIGQQPKKLVANEEWERVIRIASKGAPPGLVKKLSDETRRIVKALGGFPVIGRQKEEQLHFTRLKFLELFSEVANSQASKLVEIGASGMTTLTAGI